MFPNVLSHKTPNTCRSRVFTRQTSFSGSFRKECEGFDWLKVNVFLTNLFTSNASLPTQNIGEKVARTEISFICRQQFANMLANCYATQI